LKQLARMGHEVVVVTDGLCPLPSLPAGVEQRSEAPAGLPVVAADVVRPANRGLEGGLRVSDAATRRAAEDAIFAELLRGDLGLVARHLNKPVSFRITRYLLCKLPVTPNQVTLGAAVVGLAGCLLIATGRPGFIVLGLLLAHLQSVLDGCDGELARVRYQMTDIGEWLDTIVDDGMNLALMLSLGIGVGRALGSPVPLAFGVAAFGMLLTYNVVAYRELVRQGEGGEVLKVRWWFTRGRDLKDVYAGGGGNGARRVMAIGRRDFFVLAWVLLAALGQLWVVIVYALIVAFAQFVVAVGQILHRARV
jgi:1L-myo-inositol 1-phosphate cytidylyltransferase / CDP-L-myo-inositol myo-inositolphosphotransferase